MKTNAIFVNAVMDVRVEQGVFHLSLGEMVPGKNGKPDFIPAFRCILPEADAINFFSYLKDKAETLTSHDLSTTAKQSNPAGLEGETVGSVSPSPIYSSSTEVIKRRILPISDGDPHKK